VRRATTATPRANGLRAAKDYFDEAELAGVTGGRLLELAHHRRELADETADHIERAIRLRRPQRLRSSALDKLGLAETRLIRAGQKSQEETMPRIGITGHMNLTPATASLVESAIRRALAPYLPDGLTGVSCAAAGADTIFAEAVLDLDGALEVILPASDYRERKVKLQHATSFDELIRRASRVRVMPYAESNRDAYQAANEALISSCDRLLAVWDGGSPTDRGGTAAVVESARSRGVPVEVLWPDGAQRG